MRPDDSKSGLSGALSVIVHADDLGISESVNRGILRAHTEGIVTSASLLTNFPATPDGVARAASAPGLEVGLHLNLTEGKPLTGAPSLIRRDGAFRRLPAQILALVSGRARLDDVLAEGQAQMARARSLGARITHVDGHEHVHVFGVARVAAFEIAQSLGLPLRRPRLSALVGGGFKPRTWLRGMLLTAGSRGTRWNTIPHADAFFDLTSALPRLTPEQLVARLRQAAGVVEIMCHPGVRDEAGSDSLTEHRPRDLEFLVSPSLREAFDRGGLDLVTLETAFLRRKGVDSGTS